MDDAILSQLQRVRRRYDELTAEMARPEVAADFEQLNGLARERSEISELVDLHGRYEAARETAASSRSLLDEDDPEMQSLAEAELTDAEARMADLDRLILRALLPKDPRDERNVIVEIRGGTGGEEAALFAADLYRMYVRYAERHRWQTEILSASESEK